MIEKYEIKKVDNKEELILYLDLDYEFSIKDLFSKQYNLRDYIERYILDNNIAFKGKIVNIMVGGVLVGNILINNALGSNLDISDKNIHFIN